MKKTMKKALSVFLAVIVVALMVVPSAFAVSYPEGVTKEKAENTIEKTDDVIYNAVMALENTTLKELITKELYTSDTLSMLLTGVYGMLGEMEAELLQMNIDISVSNVVNGLSAYPYVVEKLSK